MNDKELYESLGALSDALPVGIAREVFRHEVWRLAVGLARHHDEIGILRRVLPEQWQAEYDVVMAQISPNKARTVARWRRDTREAA